ncbi:hypothetical protein ABRY23_14345 [Melioribacteraceae bacterium 4301-Me]|uniref:hypothetical protein n=1 Tax=Pyranulibacter aquaticus TaxID=3163344 RepID=UPI00359858FA
MSAKIKQRVSKAAMLGAIILFVFLMFFNLQITTQPIKDGSIDFVGLKIALTNNDSHAAPTGCSLLWCVGPNLYYCYDVAGFGPNCAPCGSGC